MGTTKMRFFILMVSLLALAAGACAPAASAPTPAPTKAPAAAPTQAAPAKAATTAAPAAPAATAKPVTLKVGSLPGVFNAAFYLGLDKGYFKEQGITVETVDFTAINDMIAPLGTGQLDAVTMPPSVPLVTAADRGVDLKMVAGLSASASPNNEHTWIVLRKDLKDSGQVKTAADLKGMKVAIPSPASLGEQTVQIMLNQAGSKPGDVEIVAMAAADATAAFANKAIAAGYTLEPQASQSVLQGIAEKWQPISQFFGGKATTGVVIFGPNMLKDKDVAQRFMVAYLKGVREYIALVASKDKRAEVVNSLISHTPVKDAKVYEIMQLPYADPNGQPDRANIDLQYKFWVDKGAYKGQKTFNDITDLSYLDYAVQKLGKQ
ncbi:MAG: ABC transporter substrate-binding protein [Dehalococcoidia bacterium]|nr:ABC transporter substrate-binding protein [Dehalococcoidia bacterium]